MNAAVLLLLLVSKSALSENALKSQTTLIVPQINDKCKNITCTPEEDPRCVRIKHQRDDKKVIYVIAVNKCEILYMKCHSDYDAKIVSNKHCGHQKFMTKVKANRTTHNGHRRSKRSASRARDKRTYSDATDYSSFEGGGYKVRLDSIYDESQIWPLKGKKSESRNGSHTKDDGETKVYRSLEHIVGWDYLYGVASNEDQRHNLEHGSGSQENSFTRYEIEDNSFPLYSKETIESRKKKVLESVVYNDEECPNKCPAETQMICAKCQHGVYKTFLSTCNLRIFNCKYKDERLELVSRYPCILSAPYIASSGVLANARVMDSSEDDKVLSFIKCRSLGLLKKGDPRCPF